MKVSVVIPCFNVEAHLTAALESVFAQDHADLEVIAVNDGSTDSTRMILAAYMERYGGRLVVFDQENQGACVARNNGISHSTGQYIQFLDADDELLPEKIAGQVALLEKATDPADLIVGNYESIMPNGQIIARYALDGNAWMGLIQTKLGTTSANLFKRTAVEAAGHWSHRMDSSQDYELMFRMLQNNATVAWDDRLATNVLKREQGSISRTHVKENWLRYIALRKDMRSHLQKLDPVRFTDEIETLDQYIFMAIRVLSKHDMDGAIVEYERTMPKGFSPHVSKAITEKYVLFHKLFGYSLTEKLLRRFKPEPAPL